MNWIVRFNFTLVFLLLSSSVGFAEYRAYELEVFDRIVNTSRKVITSFSPSDFIQVNGGPQRIGIIIRASWICYGDTSLHKKVCPMQKAINPRFQEGERVQIVLKKHLRKRMTKIQRNICVNSMTTLRLHTWKNVIFVVDAPLKVWVPSIHAKHTSEPNCKNE